jgi:hypothetical protein
MLSRRDRPDMWSAALSEAGERSRAVLGSPNRAVTMASTARPARRGQARDLGLDAGGAYQVMAHRASDS